MNGARDRTEPVPDAIDRRQLQDAAAVLRSGGLVAFPTETVYGLGAVAIDDRAIARIFEAKARPRFNPLIVHVPDRAAGDAIAEWSKLADRLAERFWPGPLTLILPRLKESGISMLASAGGETIALRAPDHPLASALLQETALPIAAPSANRAGKISPTTADHVRKSLGDRVDLILDGGACAIGVESTVLDITGERPVLLRPGGLSRDAIDAVLGEPLVDPAPAPAPATGSDGRVLRSPGLLLSHYAPNLPLRLNAEDVGPNEALLAFGPAPLEGAAITTNLSEAGDLTEAAANLFSMLHHLDLQDVTAIAVMPVPSTGLGEAIRDRLKRAAMR